MDIAFFATPDEFRAWLERHHDVARELQVGFYTVGSGRPSITWPQAVDQALCFGWIDGVRKRIDDSSYSIRFTPRRPGSTWSTVNVNRVAELTAEGQMRPAGLAAFSARIEGKTGQYSYESGNRELTEEYERSFRENEKAWEYFQGQAPSYRRAASWWVMSAKREETRRKRLATLIEDSKGGRRLAHLTYGRKG